MSERKQRYFIGTRVDMRAQATVDFASRLRGVSRSDYVRRVVLLAADRDVRRAVQESPPEPPAADQALREAVAQPANEATG